MNTNNTVLNVLMYFFERIANNSPLHLADPALLAELREHGITSPNLKHLLEMHEQQDQPEPPRKLPAIDEYPLQPTMGDRVFSELECMVLSKKCRDRILELEKFGVLTPATREQVLDNLLHCNGKRRITAAVLRWTVLMVLSSQEDEDMHEYMDRFFLLEEPVKRVH